MLEILNGEFCQRLSQSASLIIGRHVLVTNAQGIVMGSSDNTRVGTLHEGSLSVILSGQQQYHDVSAADTLSGTKPGTTIPLFLNGSVVGTIGITGEPQEISKYASLIQQMAQTFLEFQEKQRSSQYSDYEKLALMHELAAGFSETRTETVESEARKMGYDLTLCRVVVRMEIKPEKAKRNDAGSTLNRRVVEKLERAFSDQQNYICEYSRTEIVAMLVFAEGVGGVNSICQRIEEIMEAFRNECEVFRAGIGSPMSGARGMHDSYQDASLALRVMQLQTRSHGYLTASDIVLEKLCLNLDEKTCRYVEQTLLRNIRRSQDVEQLMQMIQYWCRALFHFAKTAEALHIHKSTLEYRFRRIREKYGLDMYDFNQTTALYLVYLRSTLNDIT